MVMRDFTRTMRALSDPNRVKTLKMLQRRSMCVCEIRQALGIAQSTVSKHLKVLEEAGLVDYEKEGPWVNYRIADPRRNAYAAYMLKGLRDWLETEGEVAELLERLPYIRREAIAGARGAFLGQGASSNGNITIPSMEEAP